MAMTAQEKAALATVLAVADAIRDLKEVASGKLYVHLMGRLSLDEYKAIIRLLVKHGVVKEENHIITYIGPPKAE